MKPFAAVFVLVLSAGCSPSHAPAPTTGSLQKQSDAADVAAALLAKLRFPPVGTTESTRPPVAGVALPPRRSADPRLVQVSRWWVVITDAQTAAQWFRTHPPDGMTFGGQVKASAPTIAFLYTASPGNVLVSIAPLGSRRAAIGGWAQVISKT